MDVYQSESFLLSGIAEAAGPLQMRISGLGVRQGALPQSLITLSYAGAVVEAGR
jgi:hypothetical protein